ncbi:cyclin-Y-like protein 1 [Fukomys damarensis]|uniref:cyclin-Y-like protein 1 n=1 Tax=Fukomys damarensis TaxID=885580 RepID=UPI001455589B|nr:cyclin-Y-like protein 1 [Fukomys damarensis]
MHESPGQLARKYSSCSMIFLDDSTLSKPTHRKMVQCVNIAVYYLIKNREANRSRDIFGEHLLIREKLPEEYFEHDSKYMRIYRFIASFYNAAQLPAECAIITLVFLERLLSYDEIDICPTKCRRTVLGAILLAGKEWDEETPWNMEFCRIFKDVTLEDINKVPGITWPCLSLVNVPITAYAKYYFDLCSLAYDSGMCCVTVPLTKGRVQDLESRQDCVKTKTCAEQL